MWQTDIDFWKAFGVVILLVFIMTGVWFIGCYLAKRFWDEIECLEIDRIENCDCDQFVKVDGVFVCEDCGRNLNA